MRNSGKVQVMAVLLLVGGLVVGVLSFGAEMGADAHLTVTGRAAGLPGLSYVADAGLVVAGLVFLWVALRSRAPDLRALAALFAGGAGAVMAYALSEVLKLILAQERPCSVLREVASRVAECPPPGDWSFPSNHATVGFALAVAIVAVRPRAGFIGFPIAHVVALTRVVEGVHYAHDVAAGAVLGTTVATAGYLALTGPISQMLWWVCRLPLASRLLQGSGVPIGEAGRAR